MNYYAAIDIGGTTIKADVYNEKGESYNLYHEEKTIIDYDTVSNGIVEQVKRIIAHYDDIYTLDGVAISTAGVVDHEKGEVVYSGYTIPNYHGTNFIEALQPLFALPVTVENDVNCALLGEYWLGAGKGQENMIMITIGTGVGGAIMLNGEIFKGSRFAAGEVGYIPIRDTDWQVLASAISLITRYIDEAHKPIEDGKEFFDLIDNHDFMAWRALDGYLDDLAKGLMSMCYVLNPSHLLIGGGIMERGDFLIPRLKKKLDLHSMNKRFIPEVIKAAELGNEAGRLGALYHHLKVKGGLK